ncbi:DUF5990 family protein [Nocardioides marmorisolisilvae]|uniref:Monooxygenase n=1 Tax=Nocardioides marmorisolisilvae TaxID=1542737 RepID=A0A3N0DRX8_9ACTN|nr:DUF5990 family protein [Nocardioides marmorisolisilvae]RNL78236.1 hypothetical protein EFL95_03740 [Nocardioides marmorisolisilvae]
MELILEGHHLPGASCGSYQDVHVGVQIRKDPDGLVRGDADSARWDLNIQVLKTDDGVDFRGPAVHGRRGERFVYLTWGEGSGDAFTMFRRAKLMLADVPDPNAGTVTARVHLTDHAGMPRCARLKPPALEWV